MQTESEYQNVMPLHRRDHFQGVHPLPTETQNSLSAVSATQKLCRAEKPSLSATERQCPLTRSALSVCPYKYKNKEEKSASPQTFQPFYR